MSRLRDQRGYTAIEVLFASTLFVALLVTALKPLDSFWSINRDNERQNEAQDLTRRVVDRMATELRGAGGRTDAVEKAGASDIVFDWIDPYPATGQIPSDTGNQYGVQRVRYCVSGTTLVRQEQTWGTAAPPALVASLCPEPSGWSTAETVAQNVVNGSTPMFTYNNAPCSTAATPPLAQIEAVGLCMKVEEPVKAGERRRPAELTTVVTLRNEVDGQ